MARALLVCFRDRHFPENYQPIIETALARLVPDNIVPHPVWGRQEDGLLLTVQNPVEGMLLAPNAVCLGTLVDPGPDWTRPGAEAPEGSFAIFRTGDRTVELVSDAVASRTIWYVVTRDMMIASSSQRAIVTLLGDYQPNLSAHSWMISSGTLGPSGGWDRRIQRLEPDARLLLDRESWTYEIKRRPPVFHPENLSEAEQRRRLEQDLQSVFDRYHPDPERWVALLSGGYDSRAILAKLKDRERYRFITWGVEAARETPGSDAFVARELAAHFGVKHQYMPTDLSAAEPAQLLLERFLTAGEGRVDHLSGYADGFYIWKQLLEGGAAGVIRGDEGFGWHPVSSAFAVRYSLGAILFSDYTNLKSPEVVGLEGFPDPVLPEALNRQRGESLETWRDRLYHEFRLPAVLAALNDLKCAYVEVSNPLLTRCLIERARSLPDGLRTGKTMWKAVVDGLVPGVGYARRAAIESARDILRSPQIVETMLAELSTPEARGILPRPFLERVIRQIQPGSDEGGRTVPGKSWRTSLASILPPGVKNMLKKTAVRPELDRYQFAFRVYMICRMNRMLRDDAASVPRDWAKKHDQGV